MGVEEIRAEIFKMLDIRSLRSAMQVCHSWAGTAIRQLWSSQDVPSGALRIMHHSRRHVYGLAIRSLGLYSLKAAQRDTRHWDFPAVCRLAMHPKIAGAARLFDVTISRCGSVLEAVTFAFRAELPAIAAGGYGGISRYNDDHIPPDERADSDSHWMHPSVFRSLARLPRLRALHTRALVPGAAMQQLREAVPTPFAALRKYHSWVLLADWPALVDMLAQAGTLTDLTLIVDRSATGFARLAPVDERALRIAALEATSRRLPRQLQRLEPTFYPELVPHDEFNAADARLVADDFTVLGKLGALTTLAIDGGYVRISTDAAWRRSLGCLPRLQRLRLGATCRLPPSALVAAGECCRELRELSLNMWSAVLDVLDYAPAAPPDSEAAATATMPPPVLFPQLRRLCFERPVIYEELNDFADNLIRTFLHFLSFATPAYTCCPATLCVPRRPSLGTLASNEGE